MDFQLIRHTPCAIDSGVCYGQLDVPLPIDAAAAIQHTLRQVPRVELVYSSPLQRCLILAARLAQRDACPLIRDADLRELAFGEWEGVRWDHIAREQSEHWSEDPWQRAPPGGETEAALHARVTRCLARMLHEPVQHIAVVAHGGPLRLLRCSLLNQPLALRWQWRCEPGSVLPVSGPAY